MAIDEVMKNIMPADNALHREVKHPMHCVLAGMPAVASTLAIGLKRIARAAAQEGGAATNLTLRNPSNIAAITRLITLAKDIVQHIPSRYAPA